MDVGSWLRDLGLGQYAERFRDNKIDAEILPRPPLTRNQVELMQIDTTASDNLPGFRELGISPRSLEDELEAMLKQSH